MKFTLGTEYGILALIELAARYGDGPVPARAIASAQGIPLRFLEHQLAALHKAGIVNSLRGANGGAALARAPSEIPISEVIDALEGPLAPMDCLEPHDERCAPTHQCGVQK